MTDKEILKALGLSKSSFISEQIVQTTHHWLDECEKRAELEKENAELSNSVTELTNTKTELKSKITELEKQIEKMKCCANCNSYKLMVGCMKADKPNHRQCDIDNWKSWELAE